MFGFLMFLFVLVTFILAGFILLQQGKGDMGLGSLGGSTQMLFGGSGGQEFFEKITWVLGAIFILGSLGLAILKSKEVRTSELKGYTKKAASVKKIKYTTPAKAAPIEKTTKPELPSKKEAAPKKTKQTPKTTEKKQATK